MLSIELEGHHSTVGHQVGEKHVIATTDNALANDSEFPSISEKQRRHQLPCSARASTRGDEQNAALPAKAHSALHAPGGHQDFYTGSCQERNHLWVTSLPPALVQPPVTLTKPLNL